MNRWIFISQGRIWGTLTTREARIYEALHPAAPESKEHVAAPANSRCDS